MHSDPARRDRITMQWESCVPNWLLSNRVRFLLFWRHPCSTSGNLIYAVTAISTPSLAVLYASLEALLGCFWQKSHLYVSLFSFKTYGCYRLWMGAHEFLFVIFGVQQLGDYLTCFIISRSLFPGGIDLLLQSPHFSFYFFFISILFPPCFPLLAIGR